MWKSYYYYYYYYYMNILYLNDFESHNLTLIEVVSMAQKSESPALKVAGCEWCYTLIVVQARNDDDDDWMMVNVTMSMLV